MDKLKISRFGAALGLLFTASCAQVVEPVRLPDLVLNTSSQEELKIKVSSLTFKIAKELNAENYERLISYPGKAYSNEIVTVSSIVKSKFPSDTGKMPYRLGIGDEVLLTQVIEQRQNLEPLRSGVISETGIGSRDIKLSNTTDPNSVISTKARIANDGSVLLLGVGRLEAAGLDMPALRDEVRAVLIRNGSLPNFQLDISEFNSQKAFFTKDALTNSQKGLGVVPLTDQSETLREVIASAGIQYSDQVLTIVRLQRNHETFVFTLSDLLSESAPEIHLRNRDHIFISSFNYIDGQVFLVGGVQPTILPLKLEKRITLAHLLLAPGGPMATPSAQRSAVYLLRGKDPVRAYHLDTQNPARLLVADAVDLKPEDIVFVGEQPINTFTRVLATILPTRIFARDVQNNNLP
jgi:polysaccharide export outer membrane protein